MDKILELAKELGEALAAHPISKQYMEARSKIDSDPTARQLIQEYENTARKLEEKGRSGRPIEPEEKRAIAALQAKIAGNDVVKKWMEAQVNYAGLFHQINDMVMRPSQPSSDK